MTTPSPDGALRRALEAIESARVMVRKRIVPARDAVERELSSAEHSLWRARHLVMESRDDESPT